MMNWFRHQHWWFREDQHEVGKNAEGKSRSVLLLQACGCGAVRTIEYEPGKDPVIRYGVEAKR